MKNWYKQLSNLKKAGIIIASLAVVGVVGAASSPPTSQQTQNRTADRTEKEATETEIISFETQKLDDPSIAKGQTAIKQKGVNGTKYTKWKVSYSDGKEINREKVSETVTLAPVTEIISLGTYVAPVPPVVKSSCDPNYTGCVPIASDVDCAGGSGNGPAYVSGPIKVIGTDIYGLDRNGDGIACE